MCCGAASMVVNRTENLDPSQIWGAVEVHDSIRQGGDLSLYGRAFQLEYRPDFRGRSWLSTGRRGWMMSLHASRIFLPSASCQPSLIPLISSEKTFSQIASRSPISPVSALRDD